MDKCFGPELTPSDTPADPTVILTKARSPTTAADKAKMSKIPYREAVGTLLWLLLGTRPDICYAVSQVAKYNDCYGMEHWQAVKHIFRYLKGTMNLGLKSAVLIIQESFLTGLNRSKICRTSKAQSADAKIRDKLKIQTFSWLQPLQIQI